MSFVSSKADTYLNSDRLSGAVKLWGVVIMAKRWMMGGIALLVGALSIGALALTGKKADDGSGNAVYEAQKQQTETIDFSGPGNLQGNTENGGYQVFWGDHTIVVQELVDGEIKMFYFDTDTQELRMACEKKDCLHIDGQCAANQVINNLQSYGNLYFGSVGFSGAREIWQFGNGERRCFYKSPDGINCLWCYDGYLYYMTEFGVYRVSMENKDDAQQVLDRPVNYRYLTFYEDSLYFCGEDEMLYRADLDGKHKKRLLDEKVMSPQAYGGRIYYRSAEYDKDGLWEMENALYSVALDGTGKEKILDEAYLFCVADDGIYYMDLPQDQEAALHYLNLKNGETHTIMEGCQASYLYVCEGTDWLLVEKIDGELPYGWEGGKPIHLYCVKKDGTQSRRLAYPKTVGESE